MIYLGLLVVLFQLVIDVFFHTPQNPRMGQEQEVDSVGGEKRPILSSYKMEEMRLPSDEEKKDRAEEL